MAQYFITSGVLRRTVYGAGGEPIVIYHGAGTTTRTFLMTDERGSVISLADSGGLKTAVGRYDEYGIPASTNSGRFGYTGQMWLGEVGLSYYKARMYSPTLGRFMQTDPIGYGDGLNWYNYVGSDPINLVDPTGLDSSMSGGTRTVQFLVDLAWANFSGITAIAACSSRVFNANSGSCGASVTIGSGAGNWNAAGANPPAPPPPPQSGKPKPAKDKIVCLVGVLGSTFVIPEVLSKGVEIYENVRSGATLAEGLLATSKASFDEVLIRSGARLGARVGVRAFVIAGGAVAADQVFNEGKLTDKALEYICP